MSALWLVALARLRAARRRSRATVLGIAAAAALLGAVVTVGHGLRTGFDRAAAQADLPNVIARFDDRSVADVDRRLRTLPGVERRAYRLEVTGVRLGSAGGRTRSGAVEVVGGAGGGRPCPPCDASGQASGCASGRASGCGYAIVAGHDVSGRSAGVVVERGLADAWHLRVGDELFVGQLGSLRIVGIAVEPDNVAFPLASTAHVYVARGFIDETFGTARTPRANVALVWLHPGASTATFLQQARAASYGVTGLRFVTRNGIRVALDDAAGIVVALLGAVALVGLLAAAVLIAAGAQADVQRQLATIGIQRAIGLPAAGVCGGWALSAVALALPAGAGGLALGAAVAYGPTERLLSTLNEQAAGRAVLAPLAFALLGIVVLVAAGTAWPAWRAARRSPVALLRGAELTRARRVGGLPAGPALLGVRLVLGTPRAGADDGDGTCGDRRRPRAHGRARIAAVAAARRPRRARQALRDRRRGASRPGGRDPRDPRRARRRLALHGRGGGLVRARGAVARHRLSRRSHPLRGGTTDRGPARAAKHRGRGRPGPRGRARAAHRWHARRPAAERPGDPLRRRRHRARARPRRPRRLHARGAAAARRPADAVVGRRRPCAGRERGRGTPRDHRAHRDRGEDAVGRDES